MVDFQQEQLFLPRHPRRGEKGELHPFLRTLFLDKDTAIIIAIRDGMMTLSVKDEKCEAQIEAQAEGEAQTAVNGAYLSQALKALSGMAEIKVKDPQSPMLFSVDGYRLVVMPVAIGLGKKDGEGKPEAVTEAEAVAETVEVAEAEDKPKRPSHGRTKAKEHVAVA